MANNNDVGSGDDFWDAWNSFWSGNRGGGADGSGGDYPDGSPLMGTISDDDSDDAGSSDPADYLAPLPDPSTFVDPCIFNSDFSAGHCDINGYHIDCFWEGVDSFPDCTTRPIHGDRDVP